MDSAEEQRQAEVRRRLDAIAATTAAELRTAGDEREAILASLVAPWTKPLKFCTTLRRDGLRSARHPPHRSARAKEVGLAGPGFAPAAGLQSRMLE